MASEDLFPFGSTGFWISVGGVAGCVCIAALAAGLTMGLVGIEPFRLEILLEARDEDCRTQTQLKQLQQAKRYARNILPIVSKHHLLLVTLLLLNSFANEALPLFLDRIVPTSAAIVLSVTFVLIFGEILPSAVFTGPNQLAMASAFSPFVKIMTCILYPVALPMSKVLDYFLADEETKKFNKAELKALVKLHGTVSTGLVDGQQQEQPLLNIIEGEEDIAGDELSVDEVTIMNGAMDLKDLRAGDIALPMNKVFMLEIGEQLDHDTLVRILSSGHSRIPVYEEDVRNVRGLLLVKRLIVINPSNSREIRQLALRQPIYISPELSLLELLNKFQNGRSHMALVTNDPVGYSRCIQENVPIAEAISIMGIVTLEDVMERLIQEPIKDETDIDSGVTLELFRAERLRRLTTLAEKELAKRTMKLKRTLSLRDDPRGRTAKPTSTLASAIGSSKNRNTVASISSYGSLSTDSPLQLARRVNNVPTQDTAMTTRLLESQEQPPSGQLD